MVLPQQRAPEDAALGAACVCMCVCACVCRNTQTRMLIRLKGWVSDTQARAYSVGLHKQHSAHSKKDEVAGGVHRGTQAK